VYIDIKKTIHYYSKITLSFFEENFVCLDSEGGFVFFKSQLFIKYMFFLYIFLQYNTYLPTLKNN
jgi:hypothetical protein